MSLSSILCCALLMQPEPVPPLVLRRFPVGELLLDGCDLDLQQALTLTSGLELRTGVHPRLCEIVTTIVTKAVRRANQSANTASPKRSQ